MKPRPGYVTSPRTAADPPALHPLQTVRDPERHDREVTRLADTGIPRSGVPLIHPRQPERCSLPPSTTVERARSPTLRCSGLGYSRIAPSRERLRQEATFARLLSGGDDNEDWLMEASPTGAGCNCPLGQACIFNHDIFRGDVAPYAGIDLDCSNNTSNAESFGAISITELPPLITTDRRTAPTTMLNPDTNVPIHLWLAAT